MQRCFSWTIINPTDNGLESHII